jgi:hypothetical protein
MLDVIFRDAFGAARLSVTTTVAPRPVVAGRGSPANMSAIAVDVAPLRTSRRATSATCATPTRCGTAPQKAEGSWSGRHRAQDELYLVDPLLPNLRNSARADVDPTTATEMQVGMSVHRAAYDAGTPWTDDRFRPPV